MSARKKNFPGTGGGAVDPHDRRVDRAGDIHDQPGDRSQRKALKAIEPARPAKLPSTGRGVPSPVSLRCIEP